MSGHNQGVDPAFRSFCEARSAELMAELLEQGGDPTKVIGMITQGSVLGDTVGIFSRTTAVPRLLALLRAGGPQGEEIARILEAPPPDALVVLCALEEQFGVVAVPCPVFRPGEVERAPDGYLLSVSAVLKLLLMTDVADLGEQRREAVLRFRARVQAQREALRCAHGVDPGVDAALAALFDISRLEHVMKHGGVDALMSEVLEAPPQA